ncbi:hypothetical protein TNCV_1880982 [Trichonephila clavipes]|nr:hypothetical protein TNCV_1880982 [Trichonephila clavipes]
MTLGGNFSPYPFGRILRILFWRGGLRVGHCFDMSNGGFVDMLRVLGAVQSSGRVQAHFFRIRGAITLQKEEQAEIQLGDVIQYRQKQHHEGQPDQQIT